jgi:hypothetical protein
MNLGETGFDIVDWIHMAQDRAEWRVSSEHGNEPSGSMKGGELLDQLSDY